jgi:hypothetical protein
MIRLRTGTVLEATEPRPGVQELLVEVEGAREAAIAYPSLTGPVSPGDQVLLNTTAIEEGLGSGGHHFVIAVLGRDARDAAAPGHVMKLRYTPMQAKVLAVEEQDSPDHDEMAGPEGLDALPVVWLPLHSMVGPACAGARAAGAGRVAYVMTDGAALPLWLSRQVHALREAGLIDETITAGQSVGGDREAVNLFSALAAAHRVSRADVIVVADGPGKVGTGTTWGATEVSGGLALTVASILGARPVAGLRLNFADPAYRHYGLSPHSVTVLTRVAQAPVHVAVPVLEGDERERVWAAIREAGIEERHQVVEVTGAPAIDLLVERGVEMETMGRKREDDPQFFLAAGAAGVLAGRMAAGSARWKAEATRP